MNWLTLLGGLSVALIVLLTVASVGMLGLEIVENAASLASFVVVTALVIAAVGLGFAGRRNGGAAGEPYW